MAVPVAGLVMAGGGPSHPGAQTLRSAAMAVTVDADHLAPDRASRSAVRDEEPPASKVVTVVHDGTRRAVVAPTATVGDLLAGLGITLDGDDEVTPPLDAAPDGTVTVVRVDVRQVTEERAVPVPKELRDNPALARGETRVEADGSPGLERVVFEVTRRDGRVTSRRQISTETVTAASPRLVIVGRGGGRGTPTDDEDVPLKLRLAEGDAGGGTPPRRFAAAGGSDTSTKAASPVGAAARRAARPGTATSPAPAPTGPCPRARW